MVKIGQVIGGVPVTTYCTHDNRVTLAPPFDYNTCVDRNGDGYITTSGGLFALAWPNTGQADNDGGVATAVDECILEYVRVAGRRVAHVSVTKENDVWVGGHHAGNNAFTLLDGATGSVLEEFDVGCGGQHGLVDGDDVLWSASWAPHANRTFRYDTTVPIENCCALDMLTDSNNDGFLNGDDETVEDLSSVHVVVNSDDDNENGIADLDEHPVTGEDDLQRVEVFLSCDQDNLADLSWSLSWNDDNPPSIQIWLAPDKSEPWDGPLQNGLVNHSPLPLAFWIEGASVGYGVLEIVLTVSSSSLGSNSPLASGLSETILTTVSCTPGRRRYWAGATKFLTSATWISASINTRNTFPLCDASALTSAGMSFVWIGMANSIPHPIWVQIGYGSEKLEGSPVVSFERYAETLYGPNETTDRDLYIEPGVPQGTHQYSAALSPILPFVFYNIDALPFHWYESAVWLNQPAVYCDWMTELLNAEDTLAGTELWPCEFSDLQVGVNFQLPNPVTLDPQNELKYTPSDSPGSTAWGLEATSPTSFKVWDKIP